VLCNNMIILKEKIAVDTLTPMAAKMHSNLVKAVLDIEQNIMIIDVGMHADAECYMLDEMGSQQGDLWGINLHPSLFPQDGWIEFDSMVNLRPSWGNRTRGVDSPEVQKRIRAMVKKWITE
jgi:hypothetical protein